MKSLTLLPSNLDLNLDQKRSSRSSLLSNYSPPDLENRLLAQSSTILQSRISTQPPSWLTQTQSQSQIQTSVLSCSSSLQPSTLCSTSSSSPLLTTSATSSSALSRSTARPFTSTSTSSFPSHLLNTENSQLKKGGDCLPLLHSSLIPSSLVLTPQGGESGSAPAPPSSVSAAPLAPLAEVRVRETGEDEADHGRAVSSPSQDSECGSVDYEGSEIPSEVPAFAMDLAEERQEEQIIALDEFAVRKQRVDSQLEELKDKKYLLLNAVCTSLVVKTCTPGGEDWKGEDSVWTTVMKLAEDISKADPEYLLKVAVYTRQELNIRITANFLLALAAHLPETKAHTRRYFCAAIQLPSDWLEVVRIYSECFSPSLPSCLKKGLVDKFKQFSEYQLAKYNTRKHRCKHNKKPKPKTVSEKQWKSWAGLVWSDPQLLQKYLKSAERPVVDKKQSKFSLKKLIQSLHIKEPAQHVMAILGRRYPNSAQAFSRSGLDGTWQKELAGKRMKLAQPETWDRLLSQEGNKAATWQKLIDGKSLPFMAMLRNLRNMITQGISERHHQKILARLTSKAAVIQSRQFPFRFLSAYKIILELGKDVPKEAQKVPSSIDILRSILKKVPRGKSHKNLDMSSPRRGRMKAALSVPFVYRLYKMKRQQMIRASQRFYTDELLGRYRAALETAVQISCRYNIPPLPGRTLILIPADMRGEKNKLDFCIPADPNEAEEEDKTEADAKDKKEDNNEEDNSSEVSLEGMTAMLYPEEEGEAEDKAESGSEAGSGSEPGSGSGSERKEKAKKKGNDDDDVPSATPQELKALLCLMIASCCEHAQIFINQYGDRFKEVTLQSDVLLDNVRPVLKQAMAYEYENSKPDIFADLIAERAHVDNIIELSSYAESCYSAVLKYRKEVNMNALMVNISLDRNHQNSCAPADPNFVNLYGFSEQILKFISERGSSRFLEHVEHMDKLHDVPPPPHTKEDRQPTADVMPMLPSPKLRWRSVRVFISSTFRDMHAERDALVRSVFPELRRRASSLGLIPQEVELRWGVTEEESSRALELCLGEVCRSQLLLGILGQRYGLVPPQPTLPDSPQYHWVRSAPPGLSITEMEIRQFQALWGESAAGRMLCFFRSPHLCRPVSLVLPLSLNVGYCGLMLAWAKPTVDSVKQYGESYCKRSLSPWSSVPVAWRADFVAESREAESKMAALKSQILDSGAKVMENYPCEWGGVVDGQPYVKGLEEFRKAALEDLWTLLQKLYVEDVDDTDLRSEVREQEVYQEALQRQFHGRAKLVSTATEKVLETQKKGGVLLLDGGPGEGKTMFMAGLAQALQTPEKPKAKRPCDVIFYSTAASQSACSIQHMLGCLIHWLREGREGGDGEGDGDGDGEEEKLPSSSSYKKKGQSLAILVDGADLLQDALGRLVSDWMPQSLPQGISLVLSVTTNSAVQQTILKKKGSSSLSLGQLALPDRKEIVQKELSVYGKKLSDSAFNNQLQTLLMKKGASSPLYLHMACEELRSYASFDKMKDSLQSLPQSLSQLVERELRRLLTQYSRWALDMALGTLAASDTGLRERDLYSILIMCNNLSAKEGQVTWQEALELARSADQPQDRIPMAAFTQMVHCLQSLIGPSNTHNLDDFLRLTNPEVACAFEEQFLSSDEERTRAHLLLAAHLWVRADPQGKGTFLHCDSDAIAHLPNHLRGCDEWDVLFELLSSFDFLFANVRLGLLHHLLETYDAYDGVLTSDMEACQKFLKKHAPLLSHWPALFLQQALNESDGSPAHLWARGIMGRSSLRGTRVLERLYKAENSETRDTTAEAAGSLVSTFQSEPTCVVLSPAGDVVAVGTTQGTLHFFRVQTGQEVTSLVSNSDGISGCVFLKDGLLASTSYDGRVELWDVQSACRVTRLEAHNDRITGSDVSRDRKHLVTVSLDFNIKVWTSPQGTPAGSLSSPSPLNCVTFDPEGHHIAAGCWDGSVRIWKWLKETEAKAMPGHGHSVRSLCFSLCGSLLCSGSLSGEVRLWSVAKSTCVGSFQAHRGSTQSLSFLQGGQRLLTAGADAMVQLWSGGLGRSVCVLGEEMDSSKSKMRSSSRKTSGAAAALCVAVSNGYAAVGYHGNGVKLFHLESGECVWESAVQHVSITCLLWLSGGVKGQETQLLLGAGGDHRLRVWRRRKLEEEQEEDGGSGGELVLQGTFGVQKGAITALVQSHTYVASASEDFTIALWSVEELLSERWVQPQEVCLLRGHGGGVTCLAFSPDQKQLVSGSKDQALMLWNLRSSPPSLSKTLPNCHSDWITGCAWVADGVVIVSCSRNGWVRLWDGDTGSIGAEMSASASLSSLCCVDDYVMAGSTDGCLFVWKRTTCMKITQIQAHNSCIQHCAVVPTDDMGRQEKDLLVATASEDGTVKLWHPLQVHHHSTLNGHSLGVESAVSSSSGAPALFTVSRDLSLRTWALDSALEVPACPRDIVTALCFICDGQLLAAGYESGRVDIWHRNKVISSTQVSDRGVTAFSTMPEDQLAVGCWDKKVYVWKVHWDPLRQTARLVKDTSYELESPARHLHHCKILLGVTHCGLISKLAHTEHRMDSIHNWQRNHRVLAVLPNDVKSCWMVAEREGKLTFGFLLCINPTGYLHSSFCESSLLGDSGDDEPKKEPPFATAVTMEEDLVVYGDVNGNLWFNQLSDVTICGSRPAHSDRISVVRLTKKFIISGSYDRTVKVWDKQTKKQVGMFVCDGPVHTLEVATQESRQMVCADGLGKIYFLSWTE